MNFTTLVSLILASRQSWSDIVDNLDEVLPPMPVYMMSNATILTEEQWLKRVNRRRPINNKPLGTKRKPSTEKIAKVLFDTN